jgi:hypothetical protein
LHVAKMRSTHLTGSSVSAALHVRAGLCPESAPRAPREDHIRQHTSAYVSIRQHTSAYVSIRQSPCTSRRGGRRSRVRRGVGRGLRHLPPPCSCEIGRRRVADRVPAVAARQMHRLPVAYVSIRQHTSAYVSITTSAYVSIRQHHGARQVRQLPVAGVSLSLGVKQRGEGEDGRELRRRRVSIGTFVPVNQVT